MPAPPSQALRPHHQASLIARTARRPDYCPAVAVEPPQSPADDLPPQSTLLDSHVKGTHELIAEIAQALDGLLKIAERILWVVEEARYAISNYERALRIGDDIRRQARRNVEEHVRIDAAQRVGQHLGSVGVLNAIRDVLACGARVIDGLVRQHSRKVKRALRPRCEPLRFSPVVGYRSGVSRKRRDPGHRQARSGQLSRIRVESPLGPA